MYRNDEQKLAEIVGLESKSSDSGDGIGEYAGVGLCGAFFYRKGSLNDNFMDDTSIISIKEGQLKLPKAPKVDEHAIIEAIEMVAEYAKPEMMNDGVYEV